MTRHEKMANLEDLSVVLWFLLGAKRDGAFYQGHTAQDAFAALCRVMDLDPIVAERLMDRGEGNG